MSWLLGGNNSDKAATVANYYKNAKPGEVEVFPFSEDPTRSWKFMEKGQHQKVEKVEQLSWDTPLKEDHVRFVCVSDTHNTKPPSIPDGDVLLHAGDFTMYGSPEDVYNFNEWLGTLPYKKKVIIAGNHDAWFDNETYDRMRKCKEGVSFALARHCYGNKWAEFLRSKKAKHVRDLLTNCTYLEDAETSVAGIRVYGSPWQPRFHSWGFNLDRGSDCLKKWDLIPESIDVLITHGPPVGHGDVTFLRHKRAGCVDLLHTIQQRVKPKYHVFGHIHEGRGLTTDGCTTFINASTCSWKYKPDYPPIIFDLPIPEGHSKDELLQDLKVTSYENGNRADPTGADAQDEDMVEGSSCVVM